MVDTSSLLVKQPNQILSDMISTIRAGLIQAGIPNPQVGPGTDIYLICQALTNQLAILNQNVLNVSDAQMPDTATGSDLDRILSFYGFTRRPAGPAEGFVVLQSSQSTLVPTGAQLTGPNGLVYQVLVGGTFANGATIEIESKDVGSKTNLANGSVLTWLNTPAFAASTAVASGAITGGVDTEDDATARSRLLSNLANPPNFGNWQMLANLVMALDTYVQQAFIYPAANGPGSQYIAVTAAPTSTSISRQVPLLPNLANIASAVFNQTPNFINSVVTTVVNTAFDVAFQISIPYPPGFPTVGQGGGWLDFNPWPLYDATNTNTVTKCTVTSIPADPSPNTHFKINSQKGSTSITAGLTHISWINRNSSPTIYQVLTAKILSFTDNGDNTYTVTLDSPFPGITDGDYVFPAMVNGQNYVNTVLASFAGLGPSECTTSSALLPMGYRKPLIANTYPAKVGDGFLKSLVINNAEVQDASFSFRTSTVAPTAPSDLRPHTVSHVAQNDCFSNIPPNPADSDGTFIGPSIYIPRQIGFYPTT